MFPTNGGSICYVRVSQYRCEYFRIVTTRFLLLYAVAQMVLGVWAHVHGRYGHGAQGRYRLHGGMKARRVRGNGGMGTGIFTTNDGSLVFNM